MKAAAQKEANLLLAFLVVCGGLATEPALPQRARDVGIVLVKCFQRGFGRVLLDAGLGKFVPDVAAAGLASKPAHHRLGVTLVRLPASGGQFVEKTFHLVLFVSSRLRVFARTPLPRLSEFAQQFLARMLTRGEQAQRLVAQLSGSVEPVGVAAILGGHDRIIDRQRLNGKCQ